MNKLKELYRSKKISALCSSLDAAAKEQGLMDLRHQLESAVGDISDQYSMRSINDEYLNKKVRNMHAFQISLVKPLLAKFDKPVIVDIGDSSGTHLTYLKSLFSDDKQLDCLSVNLDKTAVEKIKSKGLKAIHSRAENLSDFNISADVFLCFQALEHFMDPCHFLHDLSVKTNTNHLVITIPYVRKSRVGLKHIRERILEKNFAETTHIFELSPEDWNLIFEFSGWRVDVSKIYYQYPARHWSKVMRGHWKKYDYEGFYGVSLTKDTTWSKTYQDW